MEKAFILLATLLLAACSIKNEDTKKEYLIRTQYLFNYFDVKVIYNDSVSFHQNEITKDSFLLSYVIHDKKDEDTLKYSFIKAKNSKEFSDGKIEDLIYISQRTYRVNNKKLQVFKYSLNSEVVDGSSCYYWNPELGIIVHRVDYWRSFYKYKRAGISQDALLLEALTDILLQDHNFIYEEYNIKWDPEKEQ